MMASMPFEQNMGTMDRVVRSAMGGALLMNLLINPGSVLSKVGGVIGGAFLFYAVTGYDPLLQVTHTSTRPGDDRSVQKKLQRRAGELQDKMQDQMDRMVQQPGTQKPVSTGV